MHNYRNFSTLLDFLYFFANSCFRIAFKAKIEFGRAEYMHRDRKPANWQGMNFCKMHFIEN